MIMSILIDHAIARHHDFATHQFILHLLLSFRSVFLPHSMSLLEGDIFDLFVAQYSIMPLILIFDGIIGL